MKEEKAIEKAAQFQEPFQVKAKEGKQWWTSNDLKRDSLTS